jgi:hypothetical protein
MTDSYTINYDSNLNKSYDLYKQIYSIPEKLRDKLRNINDLIKNEFYSLNRNFKKFKEEKTNEYKVKYEKENISSNQYGVKVINVEFGDNIEVSDNITEIYDDNNETENETNNIDELNSKILEDTSDIIVEKINIQENDLDNNINNEDNPQIENIKEIYRKMTLLQLKTLVISKGLTSDSSKMRKPELLKLLESNMDENN